MHQSLVGRLLVSRPELHDPNFDGTLTLLLEHTEQGAFGLILNRPTEASSTELVSRWSHLMSEPAMVFAGGPVQPDAILAVGAPGRPDDDHPSGEAGLPLGLASVDLDADPTLSGIARLRVFAGYAGWGGGQLEGELSIGAWWVTDAIVDDVFSPQPEDLWARVLRRSGGDLQWYAHLPPDPSLN